VKYIIVKVMNPSLSNERSKNVKSVKNGVTEVISAEIALICHQSAGESRKQE
jgi:hypothetical protein